MQALLHNRSTSAMMDNGKNMSLRYETERNTNESR